MEKAPSPPEYFDIVDPEDRVVGRATRSEVHARGLRHRAVHVLVDDGKGRMFIQKRSMQKDLSPGLWDAACSGHVDSGEDYDEAASRELREELGIPGCRPLRCFKMEASAETGWEFIWVYTLCRSGPFVLPPEEIEEGRWHTPSEIDHLMDREPKRFTRPFRNIWARFRSSQTPAHPPGPQ